MENYRSGEVVLLAFPFVGTGEAKLRPALVLLDTGDDDIVVARVTSQVARTSYDIEVSDWQQAGLMLPSVVRVHTLATLEKSLVERRLGVLTTNDWAKVWTAIQRLWATVQSPS